MRSIIDDQIKSSSSKRTMSTTTFKSNLNSVSNSCSFAALKQHITTCLQRWRQKHLSKKHKNQHPATEHQQQQGHPEEFYSHSQQYSNKWFRKTCHKEFSFVQRTSVYCKTFNTRIQRLVTSQPYDWKGPRKYGRKVEIVAKLLSTTLIATPSATQTTTTTSQQTDKAYHSFVNSIKVIHSSSLSNSETMTISELTFLEIRDEYPDLDVEIRSVLIAHDKGLTIPQLRVDYHKVTGMKFPVYENVTEFLLTIPNIMAYCTAEGTRMFSVLPMEKTKHIYDMVLQQKPQQEPMQRSTNNRNYYRERQRNTNYHPYSWRNNAATSNNRQLLPKATTKTYAETEDNNKQPPYQQQQAVISSDNNLSRDESEGFVENNWYYNDNCNYLFSRIGKQQNVNQPPVSQITQHTNINNKEASSQNLINALNSAAHENNINHLNNLFQHHHRQQQEQQQQQQQNWNTNIMDKQQQQPRRSSINPFKLGQPRSSRSSSPTGKSCYTNDSAYTDSDYDAHLLDFLLLGDDFLLYMARMELRCKFKKNQRILQSGLCVSGQTICAAIKRVSALNDSHRSIILNIGSVDIMQGRQLIQIEHDFRELILSMLKKGIRPILTTLAPLANYNHNEEVKRVVERFNEFIKREGHKRNLPVIDIWKCLVNEKKHVFFDCYQNEPRTVTGTSESYLFWNKIGRQRVLQLIESKLEY